MGDPGRLRQVVVNLVGNAIKFTDRGEIVVRVGVESRASEEVVLRLAVSDTGIGIPVQMRETIFEAFTQADGSTTRRFGGTGLGLTISARLVEMMGGRISVESEVGRGSTFHLTARFRLPEARYKDDAAILAFYRQLLLKLSALPGARAVALGFPMPLSGSPAPRRRPTAS